MAAHGDEWLQNMFASCAESSASWIGVSRPETWICRDLDSTHFQAI